MKTKSVLKDISIVYQLLVVGQAYMVFQKLFVSITWNLLGRWPNMPTFRPLEVLRLFWAEQIVIEEQSEFLEPVYMEVI